MAGKENELLIQRVNTVLDLFPECMDSDVALIWRVACLYGASHGMSAEHSLTLPSVYSIRKVAKQVKETRNHGRRNHV